MKHLKSQSLTVVMAFIGISLTAISCNSFKKTNPGDIQQVGDQQNEKVLTDDNTVAYSAIVNDIAQLSLWNIRLSELSDKTSANEPIKKLSQQVRADYQNVYNKMQGLAQEKAISVTGDISDRNKQQMLNIQNLQGTRFDSTYCALVLESNQGITALLNSLTANTTDTSLKEWISNMIILLNDHMNMASDQINIYRKPA